MLLEQRLRSRRGVRIVERPTGPFGVQLIPTRRVTVDDVRDAVSRIPSTDRAIVTSALSPHEASPFVEVGFIAREGLHLLRRDLSPMPRTDMTPDRIQLRKARRRDLSAILDIDALSFDSFWKLDAAGISSARRATPRHRYMAASDGATTIGYSIIGRSNTVAFLQRLATHPEHRGRGVARALVQDGIEWALGAGCAYMLVNTQITNSGAYAFYESVGFRPEAHELTVYEWQS